MNDHSQPDLQTHALQRSHVLFLVLFAIVGFGLALWVATLPDQPRLHYLNWMPGAAFLIDFTSGPFAKCMAIAVVAIAVLMAFAKRSLLAPIPAASFGAILCTLAFNPHAARFLMERAGIASEQCWNPATFECVVNDFHRRFEFDWQRSWTGAEQAAYLTYARLRSERGIAPSLVPDDRHFVQLNSLVREHASLLNATLKLSTCAPQWRDIVPPSAQCEFGAHHAP